MTPEIFCTAKPSVNFKHFEFPACEVLMFSDQAYDFGALGFEPGKHYVNYHNPRELPGLVKYYVNAREERTLIEKQALDLIRDRHTVKIRAVELCEELEKWTS